jgi:predicted nucleotidyltransferase
MALNYTVDSIKPYIIFSAISGSNAYGTNTPESDRDIRGVFVQPLNDVLKYGFVDQVSDEKNDVTFYEIGRFMHLVAGNNPNILELLAVPDDCIIYRHPLFAILEYYKYDFLSKKVRWTFAGYAIDQIEKARGYNKKMNWEESQMTRKTVLDFCYVLKDAGSMPVKQWIETEVIKKPWLKTREFSQKNFGLSAIDHGHDLYTMFFTQDPIWGIVSDEEKANQVQLFSIPKGLDEVGYLYFNKDGYSSHCKKYQEYQIWLKERNPNRFKMNKAHGKQYDSKNMMHTYRLLLMAHELAKGELRVRRTPEEIEKLMKIRKGEYEYEDLLREAEAMKDGLEEAFAKSSLPEKPNVEQVQEILLGIRLDYYKLKLY